MTGERSVQCIYWRVRNGIHSFLFLTRMLQNGYPSSVFAGWGKKRILHHFSPKNKVPGLWRILAMCYPPQDSTPDPPQNPVWSCSEKRGDACLLLHIYVWIWGERLTPQTQQTQSSSFGYEPLTDVCRVVLSWKKNNLHTTIFFFVSQSATHVH